MFDDDEAIFYYDGSYDLCDQCGQPYDDYNPCDCELEDNSCIMC